MSAIAVQVPVWQKLSDQNGFAPILIKSPIPFLLLFLSLFLLSWTSFSVVLACIAFFALSRLPYASNACGMWGRLNSYNIAYVRARIITLVHLEL